MNDEKQLDYVDWSNIPKEYKWVAIDEHPLDRMIVWLHRTKPVLQTGRFFISWESGSIVRADASAIIGPLPPWRESLRQRPEEQS